VESALTTAVLYITSDEVHRALFLTGHAAFRLITACHPPTQRLGGNINPDPQSIT
jgi:hypothetical protein